MKGQWDWLGMKNLSVILSHSEGSIRPGFVHEILHCVQNDGGSWFGRPAGLVGNENLSVILSHSEGSIKPGFVHEILHWRSE